MKNPATALLLLLASVGYELPGRHDLFLVDGRVLREHTIIAVTDDSLRTGESGSFSLMEIDRIELVPVGSEEGDVLKGAGCGAAVGGLLGCLAEVSMSTDLFKDGVGVGGLLGGAGAGALLGTAIACSGRNKQSVSLAGSYRQERRRLIEEYLQRISAQRQSAGTAGE